MTDQPTTPRSFEAALTEFEALVERMERGDLSLEDSVRAYERGVALHRYCEQSLSTAERKIRILTEGADGRAGEAALQSFDAGAGDAGATHPDGSGPGSAPGAPDPPPRRGAPAPASDDLPF